MTNKTKLIDYYNEPDTMTKNRNISFYMDGYSFQFRTTVWLGQVRCQLFIYDENTKKCRGYDISRIDDDEESDISLSQIPDYGYLDIINACIIKDEKEDH